MKERVLWNKKPNGRNERKGKNNSGLCWDQSTTRRGVHVGLVCEKKLPGNCPTREKGSASWWEKEERVISHGIPDVELNIRPGEFKGAYKGRS